MQLTFFGVSGEGFIFLLLVVSSILTIAGMWKVFIKASQPAWAALVPIYGFIVFLRMIGRPLAWLLVYVGTWSLYIVGIAMLLSGSALAPLPGFASIVGLLVLFIIDLHRLSRSFGKTWIFTIGMVLLAPVCMAVLGFGSARYVGSNGVHKEMLDTNPDILHS